MFNNYEYISLKFDASISSAQLILFAKRVQNKRGIFSKRSQKQQKNWAIKIHQQDFKRLRELLFFYKN